MAMVTPIPRPLCGNTRYRRFTLFVGGCCILSIVALKVSKWCCCTTRKIFRRKNEEMIVAVNAIYAIAWRSLKKNSSKKYVYISKKYLRRNYCFLLSSLHQEPHCLFPLSRHSYVDLYSMGIPQESSFLVFLGVWSGLTDGMNIGARLYEFHQVCKTPWERWSLFPKRITWSEEEGCFMILQVTLDFW